MQRKKGRAKADATSLLVPPKAGHQLRTRASPHQRRQPAVVSLGLECVISRPPSASLALVGR